jgi:hypothetical protein
MKFRLRVLVAVAATAVLGVGGAVAAAVPALATGPAYVCQGNECVYGVDGALSLRTSSPTNWETNGPDSTCTTYQGESYCQMQQDGPSQCWQWTWKTSSGVVVNSMSLVDCNKNTLSQMFWFTAGRFRNLYATQENQPACFNTVNVNFLDLASCSIASSEWTW